MKPKLLKKGLNYSYFEGAYRRLIEIDTATVKEKGIAGTLDVTKVQKRADHFAVHYSGLIDIPQEGLYTFFTNSNDGSKLLIDGKLVVKNDGLHAFREVSGKIILAKGLHRVAIQYFDNTIDQGLELYYNTEVLTKRKLPDSWFFHQKTKSGSMPLQAKHPVK